MSRFYRLYYLASATALITILFKGKMIFETGDVYEGFFEEGIPNGQGQFTYANGDVETAEWDKGQRHGLSRYVGTLDNTVEEAMFWEGVAEGPATMRSADGTVEEFHYNQGKAENTVFETECR